MNITVRKIGNSEGVILPKDVLERLKEELTIGRDDSEDNLVLDPKRRRTSGGDDHESSLGKDGAKHLLLDHQRQRRGGVATPAPPITLVRAPELSLCGTWTMFTPAIDLKSSPAMW